MSTIDTFASRPQVTPQIYAYQLVNVPSHAGYVKVGYTEREVAKRVAEQLHTSGVGYEIVLTESAMRPDGTCFTDHDVHKVLRKKGYLQLKAGQDKNEWFKCDVAAVKAAIIAVRDRSENSEERSQDFAMRPEQAQAVAQTKAYYVASRREEPERPAKFLWNAKMRFGKTFATYELAKQMGFKRILVLTFKPAVESAWAEDLASHVHFAHWQFVSNRDALATGLSIDEAYAQANKKYPIVVFGSFQDLLGTNEAGGIKTKNEFIHTTHWDLVVFDEYHFGAWRENAKRLFDNPDEEAEADFDIEKYKREEADNAYNESFLPITTDHYLYLSGTPFRALNSGEFIEEQIYSWTYSDEQRAKEAWKGADNPYTALPRMIMLTYRLPDSIQQVAKGGEYNEFDLNLFFSAKAQEGKGIETARFTYEEEVGKWLRLIRGNYLPSNVEDLKLGKEHRPPLPYADSRLVQVLNHTLWLLPNVASCYAMANLLRKDNYYRAYKIIVCAGAQAGIGLAALTPVRNAMGDPLATKSITLSCGKLTTGVTVKPWTGVFMLRNLNSPETYFQTAFRVQSPWIVKDELGKTQILKKECYVFDFALERSLRQIADYSCRLDASVEDPEQKVGEFIHFLPVLAYDGSTMKQISAQDVLDIALSGTSATLLARRWQSALLVNVDNETLKRLLANKETMDALMAMEDFRSLNEDIVAIINKSEHVKKAKKEGGNSEKKKKELTDEEKEFKAKRKQIQEKLIKFATRIPIFMYLTDYRERTLQDVIRDLEPELFRRVTGLQVEDFDQLCKLGLFNASLMNDAIFKFKRYEDSSIDYTGVNKHKDDKVGGWDTVLTKEEYQQLFSAQEESVDPSWEDTVVQSETVEPRAQQTQAEPKAKSTATTSVAQGAKHKAQSAPKVAATSEEKPVATVNKVEKPTAKVKPPKDAKPQQEKPKPPPVMHIGDRVYHKTFGAGIVIGMDEKKDHIEVRFSIGQKKFGYTNSFRMGFLRECKE